jgi:hypothetical protein
MKKAIIVFLSILFVQALIILLIINKVGIEMMVYTLQEYKEGNVMKYKGDNRQNKRGVERRIVPAEGKKEAGDEK